MESKILLNPDDANEVTKSVTEKSREGEISLIIEGNGAMDCANVNQALKVPSMEKELSWLAMAQSILKSHHCISTKGFLDVNVCQCEVRTGKILVLKQTTVFDHFSRSQSFISRSLVIFISCT